MCVLLTKLITDIHNAALLTVSRSSAMKNKKRINEIEESYTMLIFVFNYGNLSLKTLIIVI